MLTFRDYTKLCQSQGHTITKLIRVWSNYFDKAFSNTYFYRQTPPSNKELLLISLLLDESINDLLALSDKDINKALRVVNQIN